MFVPALGVRGRARSVVADTVSSRSPRSRREGCAGSSRLTVLKSLVVGKLHPYVVAHFRQLGLVDYLLAFVLIAPIPAHK